MSYWQCTSGGLKHNINKTTYIYVQVIVTLKYYIIVTPFYLSSKLKMWKNVQFNDFYDTL